MPGLAHQAFTTCLTYGVSTLENIKKKEGSTLKWAVDTIEVPARYTLDTRIAQTLIKAGDRCLHVADGGIETAMNSSTFKTCEAVVKNTYNQRLQPAIKNTTTCVSNTTHRVTHPIGLAYGNTMAIADRQVEWLLPDPEVGVKARSLKEVTTKVVRRTGRRVKVVSNWTTAKAVAVKHTVCDTLDQARPSNIKKRVSSLLYRLILNADALVESYLPDTEDVKVTPKGPSEIVLKISRRSSKRAISGVRAVAAVIRNAPQKLNKSVRSYVNSGRTIKNQIVSYDYIGRARSTSTALVHSTDELLLKYRVTSAICNFLQSRFETFLAPLIPRLFTDPATPPPAIAEPVKKELTAAPTVTAPPASLAVAVKSEEEAPEEEATELGEEVIF